MGAQPVIGADLAAVTLERWGHPSSIAKSTYRVRSLAVSTQKKSNATIPRLGPEELATGWAAPAGSRAEAVST